MKKVVNRVTMFRFDPVYMEQWFEHMSELGYILNDVGVYATSYERKLPETVRYRVLKEEELINKDVKEIPSIYREKGWELVCYGFRKQWVFKTFNPDAEEIHDEKIVACEGKDSGAGGILAGYFMPCFFGIVGASALFHTIKDWCAVDLSQSIVTMGLSVALLVVAGFFGKALFEEQRFIKQMRKD